MINQNIKWKSTFENSETDSNIVIDDDNNIIIYYNKYVDDVLRERKIGNLVSCSPNGDINWTFSFPDYNYLYFKEKIVLDNGKLFLIADSNQTYDSGFERGLYIFNAYGNYEKHYSLEQIINDNIIIPKPKNEITENKCKDSQSSFLVNKENIKSFVEYENNLYVISTNGSNIDLFCIL